MAFSKTVVNDAQPILAATVQGNFEKLSQYIGGSMVAGSGGSGDLATNWVESKHLMKPLYHATSNTMEFVSGFQGGKFRTVPKDMMTMVTKYNTNRQNASIVNIENALFNYVGNTSIEMRVPRGVRYILVQYTVAPQTPLFKVHSDIGGEQHTELNLVIQSGDELTLDNMNETAASIDKRKPQSSSFTYVEDSQDAAYRTLNTSRKAMSGFYLMTNQNASIYRIALTGRSDCAWTRFINWTISVEAWI
tara:strand:+ start:6576 stop:7319 length:744 start_codon:yes stop_codon:yes gene_type:complete